MRYAHLEISFQPVLSTDTPGGPVSIVEEGAKLARSDSGNVAFFATIIKLLE